MARRLVRGFYVSLDKKFASGDTDWWRTASGLIAPVDRIAVQKPRTEFHGVWLRAESAPNELVDGGPPADELDAGSAPAPSDELDTGSIAAREVDASAAPGHETEAGIAPRRPLEGGARPLVADKSMPWIPARPLTELPVGIVVSSNGRTYKVDPDKSLAWATNSAPRFTIVGLTGKSADVHGRKYHQTVEGWWMSDQEGVVPQPGPPPDGLGPDEKWIEVDVTQQWLIALEGTRPVYVTLISSGRRDDTNKERDHRTITGSFRIREKHISATMDDDSATDGPYSIEDVPWIMYFRNSYALHGAFWHAEFGHRKSHGCINLSPYDAKALFYWTEPRLPEGWHAVFATEQTGTRVVIHE